MYKERAEAALELTRKVVEAFGPRLAGSQACGRAAEYILKEAKPFADKAEIERFDVHPGAFLGFIKVLVVFYAFAAAGLAFAPLASAALSTLGMAILVFGFFLYREMLDPFFPRKEGRNVIAVLEPEGKAEVQLVLSGHHDSAHIFNFYVDKPELYSRRVYAGIGSVVALWLASIAVWIISGLALGTPVFGFDLLRGLVALAFLGALVLVLPLWGFASDEGTPGAGDNMAASAIALEIFKEFTKRRAAGNGLKRTRLVFASFDAEEAGLRGARAFAKRRKAEFASIPTYGYNMDCIYALSDLRILGSDLNDFVKLDPGAALRLSALAKEEGVDAPTAPLAFLTGGTDAAELQAAGV
ncbi:MAG TPA: M28 family peptidase, partial [Rectinemataceae bacterium]